MSYQQGTLPSYTTIDELNHKTMKATSLGIWYIQIPLHFVINQQGEVVEPKEHNGSKFVWEKRKRKTISSMPKLDYAAAMRFKEIFC